MALVIASVCWLRVEVEDAMGKYHNSITIPAPASEVRAAFRNFHDMSWAEGVITSCVAVGEFCNPIYVALLAALKKNLF